MIPRCPVGHQWSKRERHKHHEIKYNDRQSDHTVARRQVLRRNQSAITRPLRPVLTLIAQ